MVATKYRKNVGYKELMRCSSVLRWELCIPGGKPFLSLNPCFHTRCQLTWNHVSNVPRTFILSHTALALLSLAAPSLYGSNLFASISCFLSYETGLLTWKWSQCSFCETLLSRRKEKSPSRKSGHAEMFVSECIKNPPQRGERDFQNSKLFFFTILPHLMAPSIQRI